MALHKRQNSKNWVIQFMYKGDTYIKSTGTSNRAVAEQIEAKFRLETVKQHELGLLDDITVNDAIRLYLDTKRSMSTYDLLVAHTKHIQSQFTSTTLLKNIKNRDTHQLYDRLSKTLSRSYIKTIFVTFKSVLNYASDNDYQVPKLKFPTIRAPKQRLKFLSQEQEDLLLFELCPDNRNFVGSNEHRIKDAHNMVIILLDTGCRFGEITRLSWNDIDMVNKTIKIYRPKVQNESVLHMTDRTYDMLTTRYNVRTTDWVFPNDNKTGPRKYPSSCIRSAMDRAKLKEFTVHDLRHTHASRLASAGVSLLKISQILGHSTPDMTARYAHLQPNETSREATDIINKLNKR